MGAPHVVAICSEDVEISKVAEDSDSLLLRFASEDEVALISTGDVMLVHCVLGRGTLPWLLSRPSQHMLHLLCMPEPDGLQQAEGVGATVVHHA